MPTDHILALMIFERDKLTRAIEALQGPTKRRGRPPKSLTDSMAAMTSNSATPTKRRRFSAATRRKMAASQKKRWANRAKE